MLDIKEINSIGHQTLKKTIETKLRSSFKQDKVEDEHLITRVPTRFENSSANLR